MGRHRILSGVARRAREQWLAVVVTAVALVAAAGGTSVAASLVSGAGVKDSSLTGRDVRNASLTGADVREGSITTRDLARGLGARGATGATGAPGAAGERGPAGAKGDAGPRGATGEKGDPCPATDPACRGPQGPGGATDVTLRYRGDCAGTLCTISCEAGEVALGGGYQSAHTGVVSNHAMGTVGGTTTGWLVSLSAEDDFWAISVVCARR